MDYVITPASLTGDTFVEIRGSEAGLGTQRNSRLSYWKILIWGASAWIRNIGLRCCSSLCLFVCIRLLRLVMVMALGLAMRVVHWRCGLGSVMLGCMLAPGFLAGDDFVGFRGWVDGFGSRVLLEMEMWRSRRRFLLWLSSLGSLLPGDLNSSTPLNWRRKGCEGGDGGWCCFLERPGVPLMVLLRELGDG
ncbi:hypothetical protein KM043_001197 [Ampulex compressa]|nr:hypothetical protein KM043_001197 [Ampulex compressa]